MKKTILLILSLFPLLLIGCEATAVVSPPFAWDETSTDTQTEAFDKAVAYAESLDPAASIHGNYVISRAGLGSQSMKGLMSHYAWYVYDLNAYEDTQVGDFVRMYVRGNDYCVVHRVYLESNGLFRTKGSGSAMPDPWFVSPKNYRGTAIKHFPYDPLTDDRIRVIGKPRT